MGGLRGGLAALLRALAESLCVALAALGGLLLILSLAGWSPPSEGWGWLTVDALGNPMAEAFAARAGQTLRLVAGGAALSLVMALLIAALSATDASLRPLRIAFVTASGMPAFVLGYALVGGEPPAFLAMVTLAVADLALGGAALELEARLRSELASPYIRAARARGASMLAQLWRPVLVTALLSLRTRLPVILAASVVVERVFGIAGLGDQAAYAVLEQPDPVFLLWFAMLSVLLSRAAATLGRGLEAAIAPPPASEGAAALPLGALWSSLWSRPVRPARAVALEAPAPPRPGLWARARGAAAEAMAAFAPRRAGGMARAAGLLLVWPCWVIAAATLIAGLWVSEDEVYGAARHLSPGLGSWLGTDGFERDVFAQIALGARASLGAWLVAVAIPVILGGMGGMLGSLARLRTPARLVMESLDALPKLVVVMLALSVLGVEAYLTLGLPLMGLLFCPLVAGRVEARLSRLIAERFVEAELIAGAGLWRVLGWHVVWSNLRGVLAGCAATVFGGVVLLDATCGYLQLAQRDLYAWGALISDNTRAYSAWAGLDVSFNEWAFLAPMVAVTAMILAGIHLGEALAELQRARLGEAGG